MNACRHIYIIHNIHTCVYIHVYIYIYTRVRGCVLVCVHVGTSMHKYVSDEGIVYEVIVDC